MSAILMVTHNDIPDARVEKEALSLRNAGFEVYLITPNVNDKKSEKAFNKVFLYPHSYKHNFFLPRAVNDAIKFYHKIVKEYNIKAIHAHNIFTAYIAMKTAEKNKIKFIYDDHETWSLWLKLRAQKGIGLRKIIRYYNAFRVKRIERKISHKADHIFVTNVKCIPFFTKLKVPINKISAIENIALQSEINKALQKEDIIVDFFKKDKRKKMVNVYHHAESQNKQQKRDKTLDRNFERFVEAQEQLNDWVLVLFGNKNPELEKRGVVFIDYMPRIAYLANVAKCDIGLNPLALTEKTKISSQNRVFEFAKLGLRIISTKTPLLKDNFDDKIIWFNPNDPLDELISILTNINDYPTGEELQEYSKKFSWEKEVKKMINVYQKLL